MIQPAPRRSAPFALLVGPEAYSEVTGRWITVQALTSGLGALGLEAVIAFLYPHLPGYGPWVLVALAASLVASSVAIRVMFRRWPRAAVAFAGAWMASNVIWAMVGVGPTLSTTVAQGALLISAVAPILFARRAAVAILGAAMAGSTAVFFVQPGNTAAASRSLTVALQTGLLATVILWFASTLDRLAERERATRRSTEATRSELSGVDERRRNFLGKMSHELRTPLNAIIGFSEMLHLGLGGDLNPKQTDYVADVMSSGRHLLALVDDLLDVGQVEEGQVELTLSRFAIEDAARDSVTFCREDAVRRGVVLTLHAETGVGRVVADERKVRQIILNLLSNALKFTPAGGSVDVSVRRAGDVVEVAVTDTGPGVDPEDRERIFRAFEQGGPAPHRGVGGTGLGLAVARRLAERHGGQLLLDDGGGGRGATFTLRLPYRAPTEAEGPAPQRRAPDRVGDAGIFDDGSVLERLVGPKGVGRVRARFAGIIITAEGVGAILLHVLPHPGDFHLLGWPWVPALVVLAGLALLRRSASVGADLFYVLALAAIPLTGMYAWLAGAELSSSLATFMLFVGLCAFSMFRLRRAMVVGLELAVAYGLVVAFQPGSQAALIRWTITVSLLGSGAVLARWLLRLLPGLVESENRARLEAEEANARLLAASRHKSDFVASMSHELRTPLNAIIGFADVLRQEIFGPLTPVQSDYVADIESSGRQLLALINDILDLAKADVGRLTIQHVPCSLNEILGLATATAARTAARTGIDMTVEVHGDDIGLLGDPHRLARAIGSVVDNAVAFTPPAGRVTVVGRQRDGLVHVDVYDTGPGIDPADHERIFAPFEHAADRQDKPGSGIGLALARQLVELHGGSLTLDSYPGEGSLFMIEVPAGVAEPSALPAPR